MSASSAGDPPEAQLAAYIAYARRRHRALGEYLDQTERAEAAGAAWLLDQVAAAQGAQRMADLHLGGLTRMLEACGRQLREQHGYDVATGCWLRPPPETDEARAALVDAWHLWLYCYYLLDTTTRVYAATWARGEIPDAQALVAAAFEGFRRYPEWLADQAPRVADQEVGAAVVASLAGWVASQLKRYKGGRLEQALATEGPRLDAVLLERIANDTAIALDGRAPGAPLRGRGGLVGRVERAIAEDRPRAEPLPPDAVAADTLEMQEAARAQLAGLDAAVRFTRSEARMADYMAAGLSIDDIVRVSGLRRQTVKNIQAQIRKKDPRTRD